MKRVITIILSMLFILQASAFIPFIQVGEDFGSSSITHLYGSNEPPLTRLRANATEENGWHDDFSNESGISLKDNVTLVNGSVEMAENEMPIDSHTIGAWNFNEAEGNTSYDSSDHGNHGTINGGERVKGAGGNGLQFNGVSDHVDCGNDPSLNLTGGITIEAWMKPEVSDWKFKKIMAVDHTKVTGTLSNFPLLVSVTDADLKDILNGGSVQVDGDDFLFTDENGNQLSHEIESYDGDTGKLAAWVKLPTLSHSTDTNVFMHYGNPGCENQQNAAAVWDANYKMVQHLQEKNGLHFDSTSNGNTGTCHNGVIQDEHGKMDGADRFDGSNDYMVFPDRASIDIGGNELTLETWIYPHNVDSHDFIISRGEDLYAVLLSWRSIEFYFMKAGWDWQYIETSYGSVDADHQWYHISVTMKGENVKIFINGERSGERNNGGQLQSSQSDLKIGSKITDEWFFDGIIDEVRISDVGRSKEWVETSYNNQVDPGDFLSIGPEIPGGIYKGGNYGIGANRTHANAMINGNSLNTPIATGWNHILQTFDGGSQKLYVNGILKQSQILSGPISVSPSNLLIGVLFNGVIDNVRIFDRVLTPAEIASNAQLFPSQGILRSKILTVPEDMTWKYARFARDVPDNTGLDIMVYDAVTDEMLVGETNGTSSGYIYLQEINPVEHFSIYLEARFRSSFSDTPKLFEWSVEWGESDRPILARDIDSVSILEDTLSDNILDLSDHFNDPFSDFQEPTYAIEYVSDARYVDFSLTGPVLAVTRIEENWTGRVTLIVRCTNMYGDSTSSPPFDIIVINANDAPWVDLVSPNDGAILEDVNVTLYWEGSDVDDDAINLSYELYFGNVDPPPRYAENIKHQNYTVHELQDGTTYYWSVRPNDGKSTGHSADGTWNLSIAVYEPVPETRLISPLHTSIINTTVVKLRWETTNPTGKAVISQVYLGSSMDEIIEVGTTYGSEYLATHLSNDTIYYWKVIPTAGSVQGRCVSDLWSFDVQDTSGSVYEFFLGSNISDLDMLPGENTSFNITVLNAGNVPLILSLYALGPLSDYVKMPGSVLAEMGEYTNITINLSIPAPAESARSLGPGSYELVIEAAYMNVTERLAIPVRVLGPEGEEDDDTGPGGGSGDGTSKKGSGSIWCWIFAVLVILMVIQVVVMLVLRWRKNRPKPMGLDEDEKGSLAKVLSSIHQSRFDTGGTADPYRSPYESGSSSGKTLAHTSSWGQSALPPSSGQYGAGSSSWGAGYQSEGHSVGSEGYQSPRPISEFTVVEEDGAVMNVGTEPQGYGYGYGHGYEYGYGGDGMGIEDPDSVVALAVTLGGRDHPAGRPDEIHSLLKDVNQELDAARSAKGDPGQQAATISTIFDGLEAEGRNGGSGK